MFPNTTMGHRGGKIRSRAKISQLDKKTLVITEIPFGTTTGSIIDSILAANDKGKIKIRKIDDNTAQNVEILIQLVPGVSPDTTMDALYAFTDCEVFHFSQYLRDCRTENPVSWASARS